MSFAIRWKDDASGYVGPFAGKLASNPPHYASEGEAETIRLGMPNCEHAEVIIVPDAPEKEWALDDDAQARINAELQAIDIAQEKYPRCELCGQRARELDQFGLCSKTSEPHQDWRAATLADEKKGTSR